MQMKLARILVLLPLAMLLLTPVHATTPVPVTGNFSAQIGTVTVVRTADGNSFRTFTGQLSFTGGIQAQGTFTFSLMASASGFATLRFDGSLAGSVTGSSTGSVEVHATGTATAASMMINNFQGQLTLGNGTMGLAGLHGEGTLSQTGPNTVAYSVQVHFDPA